MLHIKDENTCSWISDCADIKTVDFITLPFWLGNLSSLLANSFLICWAKNWGMSQNFNLINDTYKLLIWFSGELDNISSITFVRDLYIQTKYDRCISGLLGPCSVKVDGTFSHCCYDSKHFLSQSMVTIATGLVVINVGQEHVLCLNLIAKHLQDLTKVNFLCSFCI